MASNETDSVSRNGTDTLILKLYLDEVEDRIQNLRKNALAIVEEKASLITVLTHLKDETLKSSVTEGDCEEILISIDRLQKSCKNVEVTIHTPRTPEQEATFSKVNTMVKELEFTCILGNPENSTYQNQAESYLNACISDATVNGPIDYKFQGLILGCKLEDQKLIRQRLESLVKGRCHVDFMDNEFSHLHVYEDISIPKNEQFTVNSCNPSCSDNISHEILDNGNSAAATSTSETGNT